MERTYLEPDGIAAPPEPYSHAVRCGDTVYIAGQVAFDEENNIVGVGDARKQAERVWHNIRLAGEGAGGGAAPRIKSPTFSQDNSPPPYRDPGPAPPVQAGRLSNTHPGPTGSSS